MCLFRPKVCLDIICFISLGFRFVVKRPKDDARALLGGTLSLVTCGCFARDPF